MEEKYRRELDKLDKLDKMTIECMTSIFYFNFLFVISNKNFQQNLKTQALYFF